MGDAKFNAARAALRYIKDGMVVGLGSGRTARLFVRLLGESGRRVRCVPTSEETAGAARKAGLRLAGLEDVSGVDVAVDGADVVDSNFNLIKGLGGALAREKVVDYAAAQFVVIVDEGKLRERLGGIVPIEVLPFAAPEVARALRKRFGSQVLLRKKGREPFVTDNGNHILDAGFELIEKPERMEEELQLIPGVVANGIFARRRPVIIVGDERGARILE